MTIKEILETRKKDVIKSNILCIDCPTNEKLRHLMQESLVGTGNTMYYNYDAEESWFTVVDGRENDTLEDELYNTTCIWAEDVQNQIENRFKVCLEKRFEVLRYELHWAIAPNCAEKLKGSGKRVTDCISQLLIMHDRYKQIDDLSLFSVDIIYSIDEGFISGKARSNVMGRCAIGNKEVESTMNNSNNMFLELIDAAREGDIASGAARWDGKREIITYCN